MSRIRSRFVSVQLARVGELPAVVEADDGRVVTLSIAVRVPDGLGRVLDRPVHIESVSPSGIQRVTGLAHWSPQQPEQLRVERQSEDVIQRREAVRVQAAIRARIVAVDGEPEAKDATTLNVSAGGLLLAGAEAEVGTRLELQLLLDPDGDAVELTAEVVREDAPGRVGARIVGLAREADRRLSRFVTERQRAALRVAAGA